MTRFFWPAPSYAYLRNLGLLVGAALWLSASARFSSAAAAPAITPHPGFPRLEPHSQIHFVSPSVLDLNGDGQLEVLTADGRGCVYAWNSAGQPLPNFPLQTAGPCDVASYPRIGNSLAIGEVDGKAGVEIVAGTRGSSADKRGWVYVWNAQGALLWKQPMTWDAARADGSVGEIASVTLADLTGDAILEVIAGTTNNTSASRGDYVALNVYAWRGDSAAVLPGFPVGYRSAGIYNSIAAADINHDCFAEVIVGRDHRYVQTHTALGQSLPGWPAITFYDLVQNSGSFAEFTNNAPSLGDVDRDGELEIVIAGKLRNSSRTVVNNALFVLEANGQRQANWLYPKLGSGPPLYTDFYPSQAPALADLDGNGTLEIVVATFDGYIRAYDWQGNLRWSYRYAQSRALFASEPVIGDVTGDGQLDIVYGVYNPNGSVNNGNYVGVYGLSAGGQPLPDFPLLLTQDTGNQKGVRAAPTLADLDRDGLVEIIASSWGGSLYVWDTNSPYRAELMPWPTARHDNRRSGLVGPAAQFGPAAAIALEVDWFSLAVPFRLYFPIILRGAGGC